MPVRVWSSLWKEVEVEAAKRYIPRQAYYQWWLTGCSLAGMKLMVSSQKKPEICESEHKYAFSMKNYVLQTPKSKPKLPCTQS